MQAALSWSPKAAVMSCDRDSALAEKCEHAGPACRAGPVPPWSVFLERTVQAALGRALVHTWQLVPCRPPGPKGARPRGNVVPSGADPGGGGCRSEHDMGVLRPRGQAGTP